MEQTALAAERATERLVLLRAFNRTVNIFDARRIAANETSTRKLPAYPLLDRLTLRPRGNGELNTLISAQRFASDWWLIYLGPDKCFEQGRDVVDLQRKIRLPSDYVPKEAVGLRRAALAVIPRGFDGDRDLGFTLEGGLVTVHPEEVKTVYSIVGKNGYWGIAHDVTKVPVDPHLDKYVTIPKRRRRTLIIDEIDDVAIRALIRHILVDKSADDKNSDKIYGFKEVLATFSACRGLGVVGVETE